MSLSPDDLAPASQATPQADPLVEPSGPAQVNQLDSEFHSPAPAQAPASESILEKGVVAAAQDSPPRGVLLYTTLGLLSMGVVLWLLFAWSGYKEKYSQLTEGWHLGGTKMVEITLVREDKKNLACASDKTFGDTHCGYRASGQPFGANAEVDAHTLQPYNTIKNELFLGAGLWASPALHGILPAERFTVVCNFRVVGVAKSIALRWAPTGSFNPVDQSAAIGTLSDCVIPQ
jgi:hypothetical protein